MNTKPTIGKRTWLISLITIAVLVMAACQPGGPIQTNYGKVPENANPKPTVANLKPRCPCNRTIGNHAKCCHRCKAGKDPG